MQLGSLKEVIAQHIHDDQSVALEGFTHLIPFAAGHEARHGIPGAGPQVVITDLGVLKPAPESEELTLVARYDGISVEKIRAATGWPLAVSENIDVIGPPSADELRVLCDLHERTRVAHAGSVLSSQKKSASVTIGNHV